MSPRYVVATSALAISLVIVNLAWAVDGPHDQIGGVCVPDSATVRAGVYETRGFSIGFSGNSTGKIRLLCPFTVDANLSGTKVGITLMSVIDGDGMENGSVSTS
jgi:hypothetical protein